MAIITDLNCNLREAVKVKYLDGNLFSQDVYGNAIRVIVMDGDEPATLSGTVSGIAVRADGGSVAISDSRIDGNVATIVLPAAVYAIPGPISIVIKIADTYTVTTLAAVVTNVYQSSTDTVVDPGTIIPSINALIEQIAAAVATIPADYSELWTSLAPTFNPGTSYVAGQYVTYNDGTVGNVYKFKNPHSGSWASADVDAVDLGSGITKNANDISDLKSAFDDIGVTYPVVDQGYVSGAILYNGSTDSRTNRIRSASNSVKSTPVQSGDAYYVSSEYLANVCIFTSKQFGTGTFVKKLYDSVNGYIPIPSEYIGKYTGLSIKKIGYEDADISADVATITNYVKFIRPALGNRGTDKTLLLEDYPADAKKTGQEITAIQGDIGDIEDELVIEVDTSGFGFSFGGITYDGKSSDDTTRIRYTDANGKGAFMAGAGSTITANTGYKFNVCRYSYYVNNADFEKIGYRGMSTDSYTVPEDCYIRIGIGTTSDDTLWTQDADEKKSFTEAGEAAKSGLVLSIVAKSVKDEVEDLKDQVNSLPFPVRVYPLTDDIPLNAVDYHALYDDLVTNNKITRTLLAKVDDSDSLPVYLYTLRKDMDYLDSNYHKVIWDGTNTLYARSKIFIDSGIHGNERTTPFALYSFIRGLCEDSELQAMRNAFDWYFIPLVNPWGFSHTAVNKSTGNVDDGKGYNSSTLSNYDVYENTSSMHQGIRANADGVDINRDFEAFATEEANIVKNALISLTGDNVDFVFAMDMHQSVYGSGTNAVGAFMSLNYGASDAQKNEIYGKWMQAAAQTEMLMADYCDVNNKQSIYPWVGSNANTLRNYLHNYSAVSTCFEGGQTCAHYSKDNTNWSNPIARTFINTALHMFMKRLVPKWMDA